MKAILVVNVPTEMLNDDTCVTITSLHSGMSFNAKLKPMPNKKPVSYYDDLYGEVEKNFTNIGWNACLEELEKC